MEVDVFVGRERELEELEAGLEDAGSGRGHLFLIAGAPGIGKSRLANELAARARHRGARVLWGRCWEAGGAPAYWPWVQVLRAHIRNDEPLALLAGLGPGAGDIAQILPELRDRYPDLPEPTSLDPESARFRLFDSTTTFLRETAKDGPLVLVLDDLHAADAPSLLLLGFLAGQLTDARVLVLGAYRDEDLMADRHLARIVLEMDRQPATRHLRLSGLSELEVATFIDATVDSPRSASLAAVVHEETDGNPLFVREVLRLLAQQGRLDAPWDARHPGINIPPRIREVIDRRLGLLPESCRDVLALASVLGGAFRLDTVAEVSGLTVDALLGTIDEAISSGVVIAVPGSIGHMRFSHALLRDALYEDLPTARRRQLHREVGDALERLSSEDQDQQLSELAYHFCAAIPGGDADKAIDYARRAGEQAAISLAYEESVRLFSLALQVLDTKGGAADGPMRCRLLLALGDAQAREGDLEGAKPTFLEAGSVARKERMSEQLAIAALGYGGRFVWARSGDDPNVVRLLREALDAMPLGDSAIRVRLLARAAGALRDVRSPDEQDRESREAVEMARRIGDPATLSYALEGRFAATWWPDNPEERLTIAREVVQLARDAGDGERLAQGIDWLVCVLMELGDIAAAKAELDRAERLAHDLRQPAQWWLIMNVRAMISLFHGKLAEAERSIDEVRERGERAQRWDAIYSHLLQFYLLRREQGRVDEMETIVQRLMSDYPTRFAPRALQAHLYAELGRLSDARRALGALAIDGFAHVRKDSDWLFEMSLLPEVARSIGDLDNAEILYGLLLPYAGRHAIAYAEGSTGSISRALGILASMLGKWEEAARHLADASEWNAARDARPWVAYTQCDHALMLRDRDSPGDREQATELLLSALATCRQLGMIALERRIRAFLDGEIDRLDSVPVDASRSATAPTSVFRREGEYWSIRFGSDELRMKDAKGLRYLAQLLGGPGREFLALDLATSRSAQARGRTDNELSLSSGLGDEILDSDARAAYRERLRELQVELDESEGWDDAERATRARAEMDVLAHELAGALGLGGRNRRAPSDAERARVNVTKAIRSAISRIGKHSPTLERHLEATIRTGTFCSYVPDPRVPANWQL